MNAENASFEMLLQRYQAVVAENTELKEENQALKRQDNPLTALVTEHKMAQMSPHNGKRGYFPSTDPLSTQLSFCSPASPNSLNPSKPMMLGKADQPR